jgi:hypothetical protein
VESLSEQRYLAMMASTCELADRELRMPLHQQTSE